MNLNDLLTVLDRYFLNHPTFTFNRVSLSDLTFYMTTHFSYTVDSRSNDKWTFLIKKHTIDDQIYNTIIRLNQEDQKVSFPVPFVVSKVEKTDEGYFRDVEIYHGRQVKKAEGFLDKGIPLTLLTTVYSDIEKAIQKIEDNTEKEEELDYAH